MKRALGILLVVGILTMGSITVFADPFSGPGIESIDITVPTEVAPN